MIIVGYGDEPAYSQYGRDLNLQTNDIPGATTKKWGMTAPRMWVDEKRKLLSFLSAKSQTMSLEGSRKDFLPSLTPDQVSQINEQKAEGVIAFQQPSKQTHSEYGMPPSSGYGRNYAAFYGYGK